MTRENRLLFFRTQLEVLKDLPSLCAVEHPETGATVPVDTAQVMDQAW
jgi:hypothetical protein